MNRISKLSIDLKDNHQIEETLVDVAKDSSRHYLKYFLTNLTLDFLTYYEYISEDISKNIIKEDAELTKVIGYITKTLFDSSQWLTTSAKSVTGKRNTLLKYREQLANQVAVVAGYDDQLKMHEYVLQRRVDSQTDANLKGISDEEFASMLVQHVFEFDDDAITINDRIKTVYSQLPVRMSTKKLHEWVGTALLGMKGVSVGDLDNYMTYLKETINPSGIAGYGEVLGSVSEILDEFDVLYSDIIGNEIAKPLEDRIVGIKTTLDICVDIYTYTASVVNNMLGVLSVLDADSAGDNEEVIKVFVDIMNHIASRDGEEILMDEYLVEQLNNIAGDFEDIRGLNGLYDGLVEEAKQGYLNEIVQFKLTKKYDLLVSLYILQSSSYFAPLSIEQEASKQVDELILIESKNELLTYFDTVLSAETRIGKRARIANVLAVLNVIHKKPQEIHRYILNSLTQCKDEKEKNGCKRILNAMMTPEV